MVVEGHHVTRRTAGIDVVGESDRDVMTFTPNQTPKFCSRVPVCGFLETKECLGNSLRKVIKKNEWGGILSA